MLGSLGFGVVQAGDGQDALERLASMPVPALALVDWNMPRMNGLEFVRAVRARTDWAGLWLVMVTSENDVTQLAAALEAGADEYIMKPFTSEVITEKLALLGLEG
jgi:two-component system chemotaxis response regulator CheY